MKKYIRELILLTVCILVLAGAASALIGIWNMYRKGQKEYENLREFVETPEEETEAESEDELKEVTIDFEGLKALNPDIVAWIRCEELEVDYPVVQGADNDYYLHRTFSGEDHIAGCIFMDYRNQPDFTSPRTILYGHNMKDGSMFGKLKDYSDLIGKEVLVYLPDKTLTYVITEGNLVPADDDCYQLEKVDTQQVERELLLSTCSSDEMVRLVVMCQMIQNAENPNALQTKQSTDPIASQIESAEQRTENPMQ